MMNLVIIDGHKDRPILPQELLQQHQPRIHHAQPAVVAVERFAFLANDFSEPVADDGGVDIVVVGPALLTSFLNQKQVIVPYSQTVSASVQTFRHPRSERFAATANSNGDSARASIRYVEHLMHL
jgi:hypothetical protein